VNVILDALNAVLGGTGHADHLRDAVPLTAKVIDLGAALAKLQALIAFTATI